MQDSLRGRGNPSIGQEAGGLVCVTLPCASLVDSRARPEFCPIAIGLGLTLIHLIGIPVTNLSVNPARSTGPALFVGGWALAQLWLFWLAPLVGAALGGLVYPAIPQERAAAPLRARVTA